MTYTKAPWRQSDNELGYGEFDILAKANGLPNIGIATVIDGRFSDYAKGTVALDREVCKANAQLLAAAPALVEELAEAIYMLQQIRDGNTPAWDKQSESTKNTWRDQALKRATS